MKNLILFLFFVAISYTCLAQTPDNNGILYVNINKPNGMGDSWNSSTQQLADALKAAKTNPNIKQIWVAKGTYKPLYNPDDNNFGNPATRNNAFLLVNNVKIYGGFAGTETTVTQRDLSIIANASILSGDIGTADNNSDNTYHVVISADDVGDAELDGFTITGASADDPGFITVNGKKTSRNSGGGMYNVSSSPTLTNLSLNNNYASNGGGMYNSSSSPVLTKVSLNNNKAFLGGGMFNANSSPVLAGVSLNSNKANYGAGMYNANSSPVLTNVSLSNNEAARSNGSGGLGGAIFNTNSSPVLTNVNITGNTAAQRGGGIFNTDSSKPKINNSIIFGNGTETVNEDGNSTFLIKHSLIQGSNNTADGNIDATATNITLADIFIDPTNGDYALKAGSPVIGRGNNALYEAADNTNNNNLSTDKDLAGKARLAGANIDLGANEYQGGITVQPNVNGIIYVKQGATGDGSSWANALGELADALKFAKNNNAVATNPQVTQIWVAKGTYKPIYSPADNDFGNADGRNNAFLLVDNVKLYGGFDPDNGKTDLATRNALAVATILNGDIGIENDNNDNAYHVVVATGTASEKFYINGFTIANGGEAINGSSVDINGHSARQTNGGGLYIYGNIDVELCRFVNNASGAGGGIFALGDGTMNVDINRCMFDQNYGVYGGGLYIAGNVRIANSIFNSNTVYSGGGAIHVGGGTGQIFNNNIINNQSTNQRGGGIYVINSTAIVYNNYFKDNRHNVSDISPNAFADFTAASPATVDFDYNFVQKYNAGISHNITTGSLQNAGDPLANTPGYKVQVGGLDFEGKTRVQGPRIDIGYTEVMEYTPDANGIVYVNINTPFDDNGSSWAHAVKDLAKVIEAAKINTAIKKIWVAKGTYLPMFKAAPIDQNNQITTNETKAFVWVKDLQVFGGFEGNENAATFNLDNRNLLTNETILSGNLNGNNSNNAYHVVIVAGDMGTAELNGFTISGAKNSGQFSGMNVTVNSLEINTRNGAGIYIANASFNLKWVLVKNNSGDAAASPNNSGGGLYFKTTIPAQLKVANSIFSTNDAGIGGAAYHEGGTVNYDQVKFTANTAEARAGAVYNANTTAVFLNTQFSDNKVVQAVSNRGGGAVYNGSTTGASIKYINSLFTQNQSPIGGAVTNNGNGTLKVDFVNSTFYKNRAVADASITAAVMHMVGTPEVNIFNSILYGSEIADASDQLDILPAGAAITVKNSITQQYGTTGINNNLVGVDPLFTNVSGDLSLKSISPAVNKGDNLWYTAAGGNLNTDRDLAGNIRLKGTNIDLGAYELQSLSQTISPITALTKTYGEEPFDPGATATSGLPVSYSTADNSIAEAYQDIADGNKWKIKIKKVGIVQITAKQAGGVNMGNNYDTAADVDFTLTIHRKPVVIQLTGPVNKVYDGNVDANLLAVNLGFAANSIVGMDDLSVLLSSTSCVYDTKNVGINKAVTLALGSVTLSGAAAANYSIGNTSDIIGNIGVITPKTIDVTAVARNKVYGGADPALTYGFSPALVIGDSFSGGLTRAVGEIVGSYPINIGTLSLNSNYTLSYTTANLIITPRAVTVTAVAKSRVFGDTDPALTYTFSPALVGSDAFMGTLSRTPGENVGNYSINIGSLSLNGNYVLSYIGADLTITRRTLAITADAKQKAYGDTDPVLTYTSNGLMGLDVLTGSLSRIAGEDIGTYTINMGSLAAGINYDVVYVPANLTITPRIVTITATAKEKTYGDADPILTYSAVGLLAGDVVNGTLARQVGEDVGVYPISRGSLSIGNNYMLNYVGANLTINRKVITVMAVAKNKVYGDADPALTYSASPMLVAGDSFTGTLNRSVGENVGSYQIGQGTLTAGSNYMVSYQPAPFTIEKAVLLVTANNAQMCQGANLPSLTLSYSGFKGSDDESDIPARPTVNTNANNGSPAGSYVLVPSGGSASNYSFSYVNGTLTINALPQVAISSNKGNNVSKGEMMQLTASGGTSYVWNGPGGIISGQNAAMLTIRPISSGTYTVRVTNANGCSSEQSFAVTVHDDFQAINATNFLTPNGDGINDVWKVDNIDVYPNNEVMVFDRAGRVLYRKKGYDNSWNGTVNGVALVEGTYYYVIDFGSDKLKQKGFITLVREGR